MGVIESGRESKYGKMVGGQNETGRGDEKT